MAFDVNIENGAISQVGQSDRGLARLALADNGTAFKAGYVDVAGIAPLDCRDEAGVGVKAANPVANLARSVLQPPP